MNADEMLLIACRAGNFTEIKRLVEQRGANPSASSPRSGFSALMILSANKDNSIENVKKLLQCVDYLLDKGADVNAKSARGSTATMFAKFNKQYDIAVTIAVHPSMKFEKVPKYNTSAFKNFVERPEKLSSHEELDEVQKELDEMQEEYNMIGGLRKRGSRKRAST